MLGTENSQDKIKGEVSCPALILSVRLSPAAFSSLSPLSHRWAGTKPVRLVSGKTVGDHLGGLSVWI